MWKDSYKLPLALIIAIILFCGVRAAYFQIPYGSSTILLLPSKNEKIIRYYYPGNKVKIFFEKKPHNASIKKILLAEYSNYGRLDRIFFGELNGDSIKIYSRYDPTVKKIASNIKFDSHYLRLVEIDGDEWPYFLLEKKAAQENFEGNMFSFSISVLMGILIILIICGALLYVAIIIMLIRSRKGLTSR